ncbi:hypothetical protein DYB34_009971 [Aphanomyces astaci]|uniref:VPS9 domain-containing protein n=1 Tax=Aphanomyces astaci TaxID=112090 RepID=A0A418C3U9_APHAT|nr:hypothetical protein DYB34_009971 [Aphanomyces astaci]
MVQIEDLKHTESSVEALVHGHDYTGALDVIDRALTTIHQMTGIHCVRAVGDKLLAYRSFIGVQMAARFTSVVTSPDWPFFDAAQKNNSTTQPPSSLAYQRLQLKQKETTEEMQQLMDALFRVDLVPDVMAKYRGHMTDEIKIVVKTVVSETIATSSTCDPAAPDVSSQLRALSSEEFLNCVQMIFEHLLVVLQRAMSVQTMLAHMYNVAAKSDAAVADTSEPRRDAPAAAAADWSPDSDTDASVHDEGVGSERLGEWQEKKKASKIIKELEDAIRKTCEFSQRMVLHDEAAQIFGTTRIPVDTFFPLFSFVLLHTDLPFVHAQLHLLEQYALCNPPGDLNPTRNGEESYYVYCMHAAVEHVCSQVVGPLD